MPTIHSALPDQPVTVRELSEPAGPRVVTAAEFVSSFTPAETLALMQIPELAQGALLAAAQGQVNLDSPRFAALMALAVQRGALTEARAADVAAGKPAPR